MLQLKKNYSTYYDIYWFFIDALSFRNIYLYSTYNLGRC